MLEGMSRARELLREPWVQRGVRAALAAGLAWQAALLLPPTIAQYAYYAPLGAVIAVHPTVADSAAAAWRTVVAILLGFALAVTVHELTTAIPGALTIALIVALAIGIEQWRMLQEHASWVSFAAVLMLTVGTADPAKYAVSYAGLTLLGAAIGVLVTTVLFPPLQLTTAVRSIATTRALLARHLQDIAAGLRRGEVPPPGEWTRRAQDLEVALDRMRVAEGVVERARRANPRARRWGGSAARPGAVPSPGPGGRPRRRPHHARGRVPAAPPRARPDGRRDRLAARRRAGQPGPRPRHPLLRGQGWAGPRRSGRRARRRRHGAAAADDVGAHFGGRRR
jgi:Aromatic acid exporter family member 1